MVKAFNTVFTHLASLHLSPPGQQSSMFAVIVLDGLARWSVHLLSNNSAEQRSALTGILMHF